MSDRFVRRRIAALVALAGLIVAVAVALVLATAPSVVPPQTGAAALVPADALLYLHLSTDTKRAPVKQALAVAQRFPDFPLAAAALSTRLVTLLAGPSAQVDYYSQIRPWIGREAAFALLNTATSTAGSLIVLDVSSRRRAVGFLAQNGAVPAGSIGRTPLLRSASGVMLAFVGHYLVLGQRASVAAAVAASTGKIPSLARSRAYQQAAAGEPADRTLDIYIPAAGIRRVLAAQGGLLGALGVLLYQPALTGTTISVSADGTTVHLRVHGALDPTLAKLSGPPARQFTPTLQDVMPAGSTMLLDVSDLDRVAPRVLNAGAQGGIAGRIGPLLRRLGTALSAEGVDVHGIVSLFSSEAAVGVSPPTPATARVPAHGPGLVIVTRTAHPDAVRATLADVEGPLARLFPAPSSGPGQVPEFNNVTVAGVSAHQLSLAPGLQIDYAVFRNLVVVSTSLGAIGAIARNSSSLGHEPAFAATLGNRPAQVTSLLFLDFSQLLTLAEQTGLTRSGRFSQLRVDLQRIRAIGLASTGGASDTTAELNLQIR